MSVLTAIIEQKKDEVARWESRLPEAVLRQLLPAAPPLRGFKSAIEKAQGPAIIAEVKRASPSKGVLVPTQSPVNFDPVQIARAYQRNGATALSVLTDTRFFWGCDDTLTACRQAVSLPVLRKDFMVAPYQITHSRWLGADAILLLARVLSSEQINEFSALAFELGMDVLIEVHHRNELPKALAVPGALIGVNHRDLSTLKVHPNRAIELKKEIPNEHQVIGESGIRSAEDISRLQAGGINAFLVGSHLVESGAPGSALADLLVD